MSNIALCYDNSISSNNTKDAVVWCIVLDVYKLWISAHVRVMTHNLEHVSYASTISTTELKSLIAAK